MNGERDRPREGAGQSARPLVWHHDGVQHTGEGAGEARARTDDPAARLHRGTARFRSGTAAGTGYETGPGTDQASRTTEGGRDRDGTAAASWDIDLESGLDLRKDAMCFPVALVDRIGGRPRRPRCAGGAASTASGRFIIPTLSNSKAGLSRPRHTGRGIVVGPQGVTGLNASKCHRTATSTFTGTRPRVPVGRRRVV